MTRTLNEKSLHQSLQKVVSLEGVGHVANNDNPEAFNPCLIDILSHING